MEVLITFIQIYLYTQYSHIYFSEQNILKYKIEFYCTIIFK